jgi:Neuraminidase (sialidase)
MGRLGHRSISQKEKHRGYVQGYKYLSFQPQGNGQKDSNFKKIYIATSINNHENDQQEYKLDEETYNNQGQQWMENMLLQNFSI